MQAKIENNTNNLVTFIIPLVSFEIKNLKKSLNVFINLPTGIKNFFSIIIVEAKDGMSDELEVMIERYRKEGIDIQSVKYSESANTEYLAFLKGVELSSSIYVRLLRSDDYIIKESMETYFEILLNKFPDILYTNLMIYNDDQKDLSVLKLVNKNLIEGELKKIPINYKSNLILMTFKKNILNEYKPIEVPIKFLSYNDIVLYAINNSRKIYSTKIFIYCIRYYDNLSLLFQGVPKLKSVTPVYDYMNNLVETLDFNDLLTKSASQKILSSFFEITNLVFLKSDAKKIEFQKINSLAKNTYKGNTKFLLKYYFYKFKIKIALYFFKDYDSFVRVYYNKLKRKQIDLN